mmetsp:Transcript_15166/g.37411  ORF Transcript_15166/g.37411 Transcript_15166/m.37411 type:complete len:537 (+) Transcript_15166:189-1799(+)
MGAIESDDFDFDLDLDISGFPSSNSNSNNTNDSNNATTAATSTMTNSNSSNAAGGDDDNNQGSLEVLAEWLEQGQAKKIIVLSGAGVSTGAGIPDFRSPGTGLYDNLQKYQLPYPEAIFDIDYYRNKPGAFVSLAHELWPGIKFSPTLTHSFLALLSRKGLLLRNYTQNIDGLEFLAGMPDDKLVECHGHFRTSACIDCKTAADADWVKKTIVEDRETPTCTKCGGNIKPDIVFFGESLPARFHQLLKHDIEKADLLLVMGTSLQVAPVSHIPRMVDCNRVLFNRDLVMQVKKNDLFIRGDCDSNVSKLCDLLGWTKDLTDLHDQSTIKGSDTSTAAKEEESTEITKESLEDGKEDAAVEEETPSSEQEKEDDDEDPTPPAISDGVRNNETEKPRGNEDDDEFAPTTIVVLLGSLQFEPSGESDVLSVKIQGPDEMEGALEKAKSDVKPQSIETLHVILQASAVSSIWDDSILSTLAETLKPDGEAHVNIHALSSPHIPVESGDVDALRSSLVLNGFMLVQEAMEESGWALTAQTM